LVETYRSFGRGGRPKDGGSETPGLPRHIYRDVTPGTETSDGTILPSCRESWEQMNYSGVRLQQHLGNAGGGTKVAIDLKGWVSIEEIRVNAAAFAIIHLIALTGNVQQITKKQVGVIAIE
jgi:hypothetical protein